MISQLFIPLYKRAAAEGSELELKLRMLCEAVPDLGKYAHERLEDAETAVVDYFSNDLTPDEQLLLTTCRQLRNKVLHCDFRAAREKLKAAGVNPGNAGVQFLRIPDSGDPGKQITEAIATGERLQTVSATESTRKGTVFGWLLELGSAGDFQRATEVFQRTLDILGRLAKLNSDREVARIIERGGGS